MQLRIERKWSKFRFLMLGVRPKSPKIAITPRSPRDRARYTRFKISRVPQNVELMNRLDAKGGVRFRQNGAERRPERGCLIKVVVCLPSALSPHVPVWARIVSA